MSDLYTTIRSLHVYSSSDSESDSDSQREAKQNRSQKRSNSNPSKEIKRSGSLNEAIGRGVDIKAMNEDGDASLKVSRSVSFNLLDKQKENSVSGQRKLPKAVSPSSSALKGILIKPKRLLPPQPDEQKIKIKRSPPQTETPSSDNRSFVGKSTEDNRVSATAIPNIDVKKLKLYFEKQNARKNNSRQQRIDSTTQELEKCSIDTDSTPENSPISPSEKLPRPQSDLANVGPYIGCLVRERTMYDFSDAGIQKASELHSKEKSPGQKVSDIGVRSPSPKSNSTWDRSSSGYSSDERQDPRSPPPPKNVLYGKKHSDEDVRSISSRMSEDFSISDNDQQDPLLCLTVQKSNIEVKESSKRKLLRTPLAPSGTNVSGVDISFQDSIRSQSACDSVNRTDGAKFEADAVHGDRFGARIQNYSRPQQGLRRPAWPANSNPPTNSKIQYRKSGTESMINLRQTNNRQPVAKTHGGLEVCGKSFMQTTDVSSGNLFARADQTQGLDTASNEDAGNRSDGSSSSTPDSQLSQERYDTPQGDLNMSDNEKSSRAKIIRRPLPVVRSPRDLKGLSVNANLTLPRDDKDIRKSLQEMNSPRRRSTGGKMAPIRARHTFHIGSATGSSTVRSAAGSSVEHQTEEEDGKPGIKFYGKKMWRAPSGQTEGPADSRPFSPFGGTLPPSKIKKKKITEVLV